MIELDNFTRSLVIGISVGIGSFAAVLGIVLTVLICRRKKINKKNKQRAHGNHRNGTPRYRQHEAKPYGPPGAPSAGSSSGKAHKSKRKDGRDKRKKRSADRPDYPTMNSLQGSYSPAHRPLPQHHDPFSERTYGRPAMWKHGPGGWASSNGSVALGAFRQSSLPTHSEVSFNRDGTLKGYPYNGQTVSEILESKNPRRFDIRSTRSADRGNEMVGMWQDSWPRGLGHQTGQWTHANSLPMNGDVYDSSRSNSNHSSYHYSTKIFQKYNYDGPYDGLGFMSQSIDNRLNRQKNERGQLH